MKAVADSENCYYCGIPFLHGDSKRQRSVDHTTPGERHRVYACSSCNSRKGKRTIPEYRWFLYSRQPTVSVAMQLLPIALLTKKKELLSTAEELLLDGQPVKFYGENVYAALGAGG